MTQPVTYSTILVVLTTAVTAFAGPPKFLCGSSPVFLYSEQNVVNLLDTELLTRPRTDGRALQFPKRMQCGIPGTTWRICTSCSPKRDDAAFKKVLPFLAGRDHREWHFRWHAIRSQLSADGLNNQPPDERTIRQWVADGWIAADSNKFAADHRLGGRLAGEDFLYMHRQMMKMLQIELTNLGESCIAPWFDLPKSVTDKEWPAPLALRTSTAEFQRDLDQIRANGVLLTEWLKQKRPTLSEFGSKIEESLHGKLHVLYATFSSRCLDPNTDNREECDDLTHDRASHVNYYFWKLHGYIDQLIGEWLSASGYETIAENCSEVSHPERCYRWQGTWIGKVPTTQNP